MRKELLSVLPGELTGDDISTVERFIYAGAFLEDMAAAVKEAKENHQRAGLAMFARLNITEAQIDQDRKYIRGIKKTDRFDSAAIKAALEFTKEQLDVLPLNPDWKKTAVLANPKTAPAYWLEEKDALEIKPINTKIIEAKQKAKQLTQEA